MTCVRADTRVCVREREIVCRAVLVTCLTGALLVTGMTALMEAAKRGRTSMVEFFLSHDPHMPLKVSCISIYTEKHI